MSRALPPPEWLLTQLPGISPEDSLKLDEMGLRTTTDLLKHTQTLAKQRQLAARLQMPDRWVRKWVALAELSQIPSIGCQYCGLLLHGGVTSVAQLATMSTHTLHRQILRLQVVTIQRRDRCPPPGIVSQWIQEAQDAVKQKSKQP
jgi:Domain of unknown function (DUF4332)